MELNRIYCMDNVQGMKQMEAESVDLVVTSPPYDNLRNYNGFGFDFEGIAKELFRITKDGGVVVWVVGDETVDGDETCTSFKQALFFRECGFKLLDTMIYMKMNYAPIYPSARRYANQFEYMFVFTKGRHKTFNAKQEPKLGKTHTIAAFRQADGSLLRKHLVDNGKDTKDATNVWVYSVGSGNSATDDIAYQHPAIFPEKLVRDHINSWSNEGDVVLDPFMGSGTTAKVARALGRKYIGFEISQEYCDLANKRLEDTKTLFDL